MASIKISQGVRLVAWQSWLKLTEAAADGSAADFFSAADPGGLGIKFDGNHL